MQVRPSGGLAGIAGVSDWLLRTNDLAQINIKHFQVGVKVINVP